jgi:hypothetical protein
MCLKAKSKIINGVSFCLILFFSFTQSSCKKESGNDPAPTRTIFTVNFTDNYINPKLDAIVFISDMNGKLLADTLVSGNGSIQIQAQVGIQIPSKIMVSIATWEFFIHNFIIKINSYYTESSSTWYFRGHRADTVGQASISLNNVPQHTGPVLFSNAGYTNLTFNTSNRINNLYRSPDDLYIQLITPDGPRYKWIPGITKGGNYNIDMAQTEIPVMQEITFPVTAVYYEAIIKGYEDLDAESPLFYVVDDLLGDGNPVNSISVSYPSSQFNTFHSNLSMITDWNSTSSYFYWLDGAIPETFKMIDAAVTSISASTGSAEFNTTGTYNVSNANWGFSATNNLIFQWSVYVPDSTKAIHLPELSPSMHQMFPVLSLDSLTLDNIQLMNFYQYPTYSDVISKMFETVPSLGMEHMETSTVKVVPGK